ncbi:MAG TPA: tetratricopeptide repeat protein [Leptolyngbyaceae cyanobacterium M33_DOE_097]|uniref:Tetratricopeptide repeat protein n=1 Tax=Oscillatoriales cyanobacterium SpSt-418 TaxID=2282169 RepID=A0A7C3PFZ1_9CYAN|nr:tetratricopeptide repeat protein [Leptolyngbyaceae cyanobacterium M33_DOE_097]
MLSEIEAAFERKDYKTAAQLLKTLQKQSPQDVWVRFYLARLQEVGGQLDTAEQLYLQLLQQSTNTRLVGQARQGLQRLAELRRSRRQTAIAAANADPGNAGLGFMVLEAIADEPRKQAAEGLARIVGTDVYTAQMLIPKRGWRLYRSGNFAELQVYGKELKAAKVPVFWAAAAEIEKIQVFRVSHFQSLTPATVVCRNEQNQLGALRFEWSEVSQCVEGLLPIFEEVLDLGYRDRPIWKESTQDYARFYDIHLPQRGCVLRLHDSAYNYNEGVTIAPNPAASSQHDRSTIRMKWNQLMEQLKRSQPNPPIWSDFTTFGESAADFDTALHRLKSHIFLSREADTYWDAAFHVYSCLIYLQQKKGD